MLRFSIAAALMLLCGPAFALQASKSVRFGIGCIEKVSVLAPKLGTCPIADAKMRIWCPNGQMFEPEQAKIHQSLVRSLCNMLQVP